MAKTINYCGDSYCASDDLNSYTTILAALLGVEILGFGQRGGAHETAIRSFDPAADYTIFCWTEPHRLYHKKHGLNISSCEKFKGTAPIWDAGYNYYKYLHNDKVSIDRQFRDLYWFDREILSSYQGKSIHMWSFKKSYTFLHGVNIKTPLLSLTHKNSTKQNLKNHLDTENNHLLAHKLYKLLRS